MIRLAFAGIHTPPLGRLRLAIGGRAETGLPPKPWQPSSGLIRLAFAGIHAPPSGQIRLAFGGQEETGPPPNPWTPPPATPGGVRIGWGRWRQADNYCAMPWGRYGKTDQTTRIRNGQNRRADLATRLPWGRLGQADTETGIAQGRFVILAVPPPRLPWRHMDTADGEARLAWGQFADRDAVDRIPWGHLQPVDYETRLSWGRFRLLDRLYRLVYRPHLRWCDRDQVIRWGLKVYDVICHRGYQPPPGGAMRLSLAGAHTPPAGSNIRLFFDAMAYPLVCTQREPSGWRDNYVLRPRPAADWPVAPSLPVYIMINQVLFHRVADRLPIHATSIDIGIDIDSWCWTLSAKLPLKELGKVFMDNVYSAGGDLIAVEAVINGWAWRFVVEKYQESRSFGRDEVTISGRGESALLAEPYAPAVTSVNDQIVSANQAAAAMLDNTPFSIVWHIDDWLIAEGCLALDKATPLAAIQQIAEAAAGRVQSARADRTLTVMPRLLDLPWKWPGLTPAIGIPEAMIKRLGRDVIQGQPVNAVYVAGQSAGVLFHF